MNYNLETICQELYKTPKDQGEENFVKFIENNFTLFKKNLDDFQDDVGQKVKDHKDLIVATCDGIVECLELYHRGFTFLAYQKFEQTLNALGSDSKVLNPPYYLHNVTKLKRLYRARISEDILLQREEMFHPPSDLRHVLSDQRYSIRGLPCLYLADSSYLCWEELGQPELSRFWISRFEIDRQSLPVLDLNPTSDFLVQGYQLFSESDTVELNSFESMIPYLMLVWPVQMATSVQVAKKYKNANFKPEYIIPQFLMEWMRTTNKFSGVCYPTTKSTMAKPTVKSMVNYAIPAIDISNNRFCKYLSKHIKMTSPISVKLLDILELEPSKEDILEAMRPKVDEDMFDFPGHFELAPNPDTTQVYHRTKFAKLEGYLNSLPATSLPE